MAKKKQEYPATTVLTMDKDEFRSLLEKRIDEGKALLNINIPTKPSTSNYRGYGYVDLSQKTYDETRLDEFKKKYRKWNDFNQELLKRAFIPSSNEYLDSYTSCASILIWGEGEDALKRYHGIIEDEITKLENLLNKLSLIPCDADSIPVPKQIGRSTGSLSVPTIRVNQGRGLGKDVFIVHGHDNEMKQTVARVLEKLGLHPIILHEQPNEGKTIMEKLEKAASTAGFAVILLTADDTGKANREELLKPRARQNVVFEMGYFIGKIGRNRVMPLLESGVDKPGDLDGIVYTSIDKAEAWKYCLVKELKRAGYPVSADDIL